METKTILDKESLSASVPTSLKSQRKKRRAKYRAKKRREFVARLSALYNPLADGNRLSSHPTVIYMKSFRFNATLMEIQSLQARNPDFGKDTPPQLSNTAVSHHEFTHPYYSKVPKMRLNLKI